MAKQPELIELIDSDDCKDMGIRKMTEDERKRRHKVLTRRLHRTRKTPCKFKFEIVDNPKYLGLASMHVFVANPGNCISF